MYFDYHIMRAKALKTYDNTMREIDLWEKIEVKMSEAAKTGIKEFAIKTELRVWNDIPDYANKLNKIAVFYRFTLYKVEHNGDNFIFYIKRLN